MFHDDPGRMSIDDPLNEWATLAPKKQRIEPRSQLGQPVRQLRNR